MTQNSPFVAHGETAGPVPGRRRPWSALAVLLFAGICCGKGEAPGGGAAAPKPTETAAPERQPTIVARPMPDRAPFSGLRGARDSAIDGTGRLWVANTGSNAIAIFDLSGGYLGGWGNRGTGQYQLSEPCGIAIRGDDVYVADTWNARVQMFSASGQWKARFLGDFFGPRGIAVGPDGRVWIADTGNSRVVVCEKDLTGPRSFGKKGAGPEELTAPVGIGVGPDGDVYVADTNNQRIQILDKEGRFKNRWAVAGWGPSCEPYLEVDSDGTVYATDPPGQAVIQINRSGKEVRRWTTDDEGARFQKPTGIALDSKNRALFITNTDTGTIVKLKLSGKP